MYNEEDKLGWSWAILIISVAIVTGLIVADYTGLTDKFINSFA